ncbi:hypothetical protein KFK09_010658 [Dendrobium nobile]|uniref:Uncharacterized protein n=1 Tax=Dendrobium nobile TaxID=94219 RepID=A0A8T3BG84_DENNO|nr:hypothetical protein KFK09_010658 [Dendrobium nobile]
MFLKYKYKIPICNNKLPQITLFIGIQSIKISHENINPTTPIVTEDATESSVNHNKRPLWAGYSKSQTVNTAGIYCCRILGSQLMIK